ncbi:MAG: menaquinol oxidoreductase [Deltaproteobacteria bacterium]|nr:menaquinol oxidoreductase [Deltaproteobacteria bacterium]TLN01909.1 MAG: menaquinol oxidoreductase [bacterium]
MKISWFAGSLTLSIVAIILLLTVMYLLPLDFTERSPVQPLAFSHKMHAGGNGIHCLYCHRNAAKSPVAGIPSVADCRSCHLFIAPDKPEIKKLMDYWDKGQGIPWIRVNNVPDHVYFPHMMHIRSRIDCSVCHGQVATMERISRTANLKMGWCLDCHRQHKASIDCWTCHL